MDELFVISEGGQLIFSWHSQKIKRDPEKDDDLIGGFLTAINTFASLERGEDIKSLKLKESTIIFEKYEEKLTFVATTKNDDLVELSHAMLHQIIDTFIQMYPDLKEEPFQGEVTRFYIFKETVEKMVYAYGLDQLEDSLKLIDKNSLMKSIIYLDPNAGHILYIHAKQYVNKEKLSFLVPLILNSARLLYKNNIGEDVHWILLNTVRNENLLVETRDKILLVKQYQLKDNYEEEILALEFFQEKDKYVKKPKKITKQFESLIWDPKIKQIYLVDLMGKILYSKIIDPTYDCRDYIPETIGFLTSSKNASDQIYSRTLFNASIGGDKKFTTICINFSNFALALIGDIRELSNFQTIQKICEDILVQLL